MSHFLSRCVLSWVCRLIGWINSNQGRKHGDFAGSRPPTSVSARRTQGKSNQGCQLCPRSPREMDSDQSHPDKLYQDHSTEQLSSIPTFLRMANIHSRWHLTCLLHRMDSEASPPGSVGMSRSRSDGLTSVSGRAPRPRLARPSDGLCVVLW